MFYSKRNLGRDVALRTQLDTLSCMFVELKKEVLTLKTLLQEEKEDSVRNYTLKELRAKLYNPEISPGEYYKLTKTLRDVYPEAKHIYFDIKRKVFYIGLEENHSVAYSLGYVRFLSGTY